MGVAGASESVKAGVAAVEIGAWSKEFRSEEKLDSSVWKAESVSDLSVEIWKSGDKELRNVEENKWRSPI